MAYRATIYRTGGCSAVPYQSNRFGDSKCVLISYYFATYVSEVKILLFKVQTLCSAAGYY